MVNVSALLIMFLTLIVGFALVPTIQDQSDNAAGNSTGAAATFYGLVPLFYSIVIIGIIVGSGFAAFKDIGGRR